MITCPKTSQGKYNKLQRDHLKSSLEQRENQLNYIAENRSNERQEKGELPTMAGVVITTAKLSNEGLPFIVGA